MSAMTWPHCEHLMSCPHKYFFLPHPPNQMFSFYADLLPFTLLVPSCLPPMWQPLSTQHPATLQWACPSGFCPTYKSADRRPTVSVCTGGGGRLVLLPGPPRAPPTQPTLYLYLSWWGWWWCWYLPPLAHPLVFCLFPSRWVLDQDGNETLAGLCW